MRDYQALQGVAIGPHQLGVPFRHEADALTEPTSSSDARAALADLVSPVSAFVRDGCDRGGEDPVDELFSAWRSWCEDNGHRAGVDWTAVTLSCDPPTVCDGWSGLTGSAAMAPADLLKVSQRWYLMADLSAQPVSAVTRLHSVSTRSASVLHGTGLWWGLISSERFRGDMLLLDAAGAASDRCNGRKHRCATEPGLPRHSPLSPSPPEPGSSVWPDRLTPRSDGGRSHRGRSMALSESGMGPLRAS